MNKKKIYPWLVVALLFVVGCLNYLDRTTITTMRSSIVQAIRMNDSQFGLLTAAFLWTYGLLSPFAGFLADRFNRSKVVMISLFVWSLVTFATSFAQTFEQLLLTRFLMGISEACYIPAALALIMDYHPGPTRSLANGLHMAGIAVGQSLGFIGGWIAENHSWNHAFSIFGGVGIGYAFLLLFTLKDPRGDARTQGTTTTPPIRFGAAVKELAGGRNYLLALLSWTLLGIAGWILIGWMPTYYKEHFHLSQTDAGVYATVYFYPFSLVGVVIGGWLADRWSLSNPRGRMLVPAIGMLIAAPAVFIASSTSLLPVAVTGFLTYAFLRVFTDANMMPILCLVTDERYRATGYGVLNMFSCVIGGVGIYTGGALRDADTNLSLVFKIAAFLLLCCGLTLLRIRQTEKTSG